MGKTCLSQQEQKRLAGRGAVDALVERGILRSGCKIGLGTGSTAIEAIKRIGELLAEGVLSGIRAAVTSLQTEMACENLEIPVFPLSSREIQGCLDVAIDGADEIDDHKYLIKGGGAALFREKLAAYNASYFVIIADESKLVSSLGTGFALPVEVLPLARLPVCAALEKLGARPSVREGVRKCGPVITDNGNIVLDCRWEEPIDPVVMEEKIKGICGVVENGIFAHHPRVLVFAAKADGTLHEK